MRTTFSKEDFLDFSYNNKWASEMGLIKVNTGKRQDDEILPASKDTTIDVPGSDGVYYLNSKFQQKEFTINFAYDGLKERDIRNIREWLAPKKECRLIFSERPYKYYMAKPKSAPKLSYIAFDDTDGTRVYRGEGAVQFVCYYPWARSVTLYEDDLVGVNAQQSAESGLIKRDEEVVDGIKYNQFISGNQRIYVHNGGQMPCPFQFQFKITAKTSDYLICTLSTKAGSGEPGGVLHQLILRLSDLDVNTSWILDSETHIIACPLNSSQKGNKITYNIDESKGIKNGAIVAGDFFNLPVGDSILQISGATISVNAEAEQIFYDYLYY